MKYWIALAIGVLSVFRWEGDVWHSRWALLLAILSIALGRIAWKRVHWSAGLALGYMLLSGIWLFAWRANQYAGLSGLDRIALSDQAGYASACLLLICVPLLFLKYSTAIFMDRALGWICLANSAVVIAQACLGEVPFHRGGLYGNASMNACLIAFTYPFLCFRPQISPTLARAGFIKNRKADALYYLIATVLPVVAVFLSGSSQAIGVLGVIWGLYLFSGFDGIIPSTWSLSRKVGTFALPVLGCLALGKWTLGADLWADSGRFGIWKLMMNHWIQNMDPVFGSGLGSYILFGPHIQSVNHYATHQWFIFLHSEPLQILFETGVVGLLLTGTVGVCAFLRAWQARNAYLCCALLGFVATSLANYPLRMPVHAVIGAVILVLCFGVRDERRA